MAATLPEKFGRFKVTGEIGRGAMGIVYRAHDSALGRTVAIKTVALTGSGADRDANEARFLQEARAAGSLSHPAIVTIYDIGREGDTAFIAMELVEGRDLRELIAQGRMAPSKAVAIAASVAEGLAYAHDHGIVHRDIKPGNIMVLDDGRVKIMDFGIARLHEPSVKTQTGVLLGSPQYMSPEQIVGQEVDRRGDVFSLGLVLYEMLTGVRPFQGEDIPDLMFKVANMPATPPSHLAPELPAIVDFIAARALKKKAEERYQSAAEMAKDLRDCASTVPDTAGKSAATETATVPLAPREETLELRPSPRFDSSDGLARLAVLAPESEQTSSRAGWTVKLARPRRRLERERALLLAAYGLALIAAIALVVL